MATQGKEDHGNENQWLTSYHLLYSATTNTANLQYISGADSNAITFPANSDRQTIVENQFSPVQARVFRLEVVTYNNWISTRWEVYGCDDVPVLCPGIVLENSVTDTSAVAPDTVITISCTEGYSFGNTHTSDELIATCTSNGAWDIDLSQYSCTGKLYTFFPINLF